MNGLDIWWKDMSVFNETITIYNHYIDKLTRVDKWHRTVLTGCMWRRTTTKTVGNNQIQIDDSVSVTIPYRSGYLPPKEYAKLPNDEMVNYWTLDANSNLDIVVLGRIEVNLTDEYTITNVKKDYDNVATISAVSDNTRVNGLKHWKVSGK